MEQGPTITQVVNEIVNNVTVLSIIGAPIVFGVIEFAKKLKFPSKYAGLLAAPVGVLVMFCVQGFTFSGVGVLIGVLTGFATSGLYSTAKAATSDKKVV